MKKLLSLALSVAFMCTMGVPVRAAASASAEARLAAVTEKVKATLGLDTTGYTAFHGDMEEGAVTPTWQLYWSGEDTELTITATEEGKILSYHRYDGREEMAISSRDSFGARFPKLTRADAQVTAQAFLDKVLTSAVESAQFQAEPREALSANSHSFSGKVQEHGLPSPFGFHISVRVSDNAVTAFYLNGEPQNYLGGIPAAVPAVDATKAGETVKATLKLRLEYVLDDTGKRATLRYLPEDAHNDYYVDAQTGTLVDLTALEQEVWDKSTGNAISRAPAEGARKENSFTEAELAGVANMEGVLSKDELEATTRSLTALGLGKYTLAKADYRMTDKETGAISATLQYAYKSGDSVYYRTVTVNAKTGELLTVYSSRPWKDGETATVGVAQSKASAEAFLTKICPDQFAKTAHYGELDASQSVVRSFQYAAQENGYFLPESSISVEVDGTDGSISGYYNSYVADVVFERADGIVERSAALAAWFDTHTVHLGYLAVPQKLDLSQPAHKPLMEQGRKFLYTRTLAYYMEQDEWYLGIDAKTGEAVKGTQESSGAITYSDLSSHWIRAQAERLAQYGVGWQGGQLNPAQELTQLDLLVLLMSATGYRYDPAEEQGADHLYSAAYSRGLLEKAQRNDTALVTRAQMTKLLLDSAGYANLAGLEGIFTCAFADAATIPADCYGYAAVAQGLGLVKGDKAGNFAPARVATRAEAVSMLYNFISR